jgi:hypothetical protein
MYKLKMYFMTEKDIWKEGCTGEYGTEWQEIREFDKLKDLKEFVKDNTYSSYKYIEFDDYNKNYITSYMATDENIGEMTKQEMHDWKRGKINGWVVNCDITIEKYDPKRVNNIKFN